MNTEKISDNIVELEKYINRISHFSDSITSYSHFTSLIRCSLIKSYEFLKLVYLEEKFNHYFFVTSFLRGIVEDVVVLESIHGFDSEKREKLLGGIQRLEVNDRAITQWEFFQKYRPFQPVIDKAIDIDEALATVQTIWREAGWSTFNAKPKKTMPPVIQLAQKLAPGVLDLLYDFIYRLSSTTVHFSPQTLLKTSWGNVDDENNITGTISVRHMANYYKTYSQVYGVLLFSFYFELFPTEIEATSREQSVVEAMRKSILEKLRWPEMITFEEMNLPTPKAYHDQILLYGALHQATIQMLKDGFINSKYEGFIEAFKTDKNKTNV
jgi:hypothetical protein